MVLFGHSRGTYKYQRKLHHINSLPPDALPLSSVYTYQLPFSYIYPVEVYLLLPVLI
jgi:hypothetical protein